MESRVCRLRHRHDGLFIVLWLLNTNDKVNKAVESYFKDLSGSGKQMGSAMAGVGETVVISKDDMHQLRDKLEQAMKTIPMFQRMFTSDVLN